MSRIALPRPPHSLCQFPLLPRNFPHRPHFSAGAMSGSASRNCCSSALWWSKRSCSGLPCTSCGSMCRRNTTLLGVAPCMHGDRLVVRRVFGHLVDFYEQSVNGSTDSGSGSASTGSGSVAPCSSCETGAPPTSTFSMSVSAAPPEFSASSAFFRGCDVRFGFT